jgi:hypothetical protein
VRRALRRELAPVPDGGAPSEPRGPGSRILTAGCEDNWQRKNQILTEWCHKVGRDPKAVERTCSISPDLYGQIDDLLHAGVEHFILRGPQPFDATALEQLLKLSGR